MKAKKVKLTANLIIFLDKHCFTKEELKDTEFISNSVSNYPDYSGEFEDITDDQSMDIAREYQKFKN